ncbi:acyl-CoA dehydrogenase [Nocardioides daeguensis]|uniref:Acyl-CoA dehydrogenase n=1 Tax=Nocardioides daeguensis TaxID=908359 RepID=A0ABP6UTR0_9ACTN|nr:acyl-CoA dehydrogenase [Nocardioides daeguensis]MBV6728310.1 acyl-CoA dehydrogenase [Nocardioides daeguensis]MCR1773119.1 acyl-CoA dehydrogenase [Nocardioides daeguensis]
MSPDLLLARRDLAFLLHEWLEVTALCSRERYAEHSRDTFDAVLDLSAELAAEHFAPHNALSDAQEPQFDGESVTIVPEVGAAVRAFAEAGLLSAAMDEAVGGGQLPHVVQQACFAWFQAANVATSGYPMLTMANANLLLAHATPEQVARFVPPMLDGRWFGTMCLSEPQAGSSLADVATRAVRQPDGSFRLFGNKMWISGGDHELGENIVHLVLARVEGAPPGVKGLSLFATPKYVVDAAGGRGERNDVTLAGLNHKMGFRGTVNTVLNFGEGRHLPGGAPGAVGELVGEEGRGLAVMFHMMNEARIGVGAGAVALGYTGYLRALSYARERAQGRPLAGKDPAAPQVPIAEHADVRRMLLASKSYVEGGLALVLRAALLLDEQHTHPSPEARARAGALLDVLTPIVKSWPSQWCLAANDLAIQVHGGYGYTREYGVEQLYRDNRLNPIHEGTHGIQALDLLGRKLVQARGSGLQLLLEAVRETVERARGTGDAALASYADRVAAAADRFAAAVAAAWESGDPRTSLVNATTGLEAAGHVVIAWTWLDQLVAVGDREGAFYDGKRAAGRYFLTHELPKVGPMLDLLAGGDQLFNEVDPATF